MEYIRELLESLDELKPISTSTEERVAYDPEIKLVVFDIYGTLIISASGDVDEADLTTEHLKLALTNSGYNIKNENSLNEILINFPKTVRHHHKNLNNYGIKYPDVDFVEVWNDVLELAFDQQLIETTHQSDVTNFTFAFELLSNKVYPMPGMLDVIKEINRHMPTPGIISNAQFFTPVIMNYFISGKIIEKETIELFDPELSTFSYKSLRAKPDVRLFKELSEKIKTKHNIEPEQVLYVGNDMLKDIYTANSAGFKTALFAGDKRSLRLRKNREEVKNVKPDYVIKELKQVLQITGL